MDIRELNRGEYAAALELCLRVFMKYEAPDYSAQGVESFLASIRDPEYVARLRIYGAFDGDAPVGVLATRSGGTHIALFFVDSDSQGQGVGRKLFYRAVQDCPEARMTVNSSPYAVEIYRHLGFCETAPEQTTDGLRYTPMQCVTGREDCPCKRNGCSRHGKCVLCRAHHGQLKGSPTACQRPSREEKREQRRRERGRS